MKSAEKKEYCSQTWELPQAVRPHPRENPDLHPRADRETPAWVPHGYQLKKWQSAHLSLAQTKG